MEQGSAGRDTALESSTRAVLLGASGFIGRWVARTLTQRGVRLWCPVRDPATAESVLAQYAAKGELVAADLCDPTSLNHLLAEVRPHLVYNLAGYGVDQRERDDAVAKAINVDLVRFLISVLPQFRDRSWTGHSLVHTGSALEYGVVGGDLREETTPNPTTSYGITKLSGTRLVTEAASTGSLRGVVARLFTVYGPGEHDGRLVPTLFEAAKQSDRIPLSLGTQQRDFTYVEDVVEGLHRLAKLSGPAASLMNLATGKLMTVRAFIEKAAPILSISETRLGFGDVPTRAEEMQHEAVSTGRLQAALGWVPATSVEDGIRATAAFGRSRNAVE